MIFIFLPCCEKTHDKKKSAKEFSREISKPCCESQIMTC